MNSKYSSSCPPYKQDNSLEGGYMTVVKKTFPSFISNIIVGNKIAK